MNPLLLSLQELVVLAAIGNPEAKTYGMSFAYMGILLLAIALGFLIIMFGSRSRYAQGEQSPHMSRTGSYNWTATRLFPLGWGIAVVSTYFIVTILPRVVSYYAWVQDLEYPELIWCYHCGGWESSLGPEISIVLSAVALAGLVIGIIMVATKGRERIGCESLS